LNGITVLAKQNLLVVICNFFTGIHALYFYALLYNPISNIVYRINPVYQNSTSLSNEIKKNCSFLVHISKKYALLNSLTLSVRLSVRLYPVNQKNHSGSRSAGAHRRGPANIFFSNPRKTSIQLLLEAQQHKKYAQTTPLDDDVSSLFVFAFSFFASYKGILAFAKQNLPF
jgi:hypothetical protein